MSFRTPVVLAALVAILAPVASAQTFTRVAGPWDADSAASRSVNWVDLDGDGDLDLFVSNGHVGGEINFLYRNEGDGTFTKIPGDPIATYAMPSDGASFADVDNDGDLDGFVVAWYDSNNSYFRNEGLGNFTQLVVPPLTTDHGYSETCNWGDYDNDGRLDLFVSNSGSPTLGGPKVNFLYHQESDGTFTRILTGAIATDAFYSRGMSWIDYDNDGDLDVFVCNERNGAENLYRNELVETGSANFTKITAGPLVTAAGNTYSASWGDVDNDGDFDVFLANGSPGSQFNAFFLNNGDGTFTRVTTDSVTTDLGPHLSCAWGDMDNDGDLDLYVTGAYGSTAGTSVLYRNRLREDGALSFRPVRTAGPITSDSGYMYGCAWGDYDRDGDLDMFVAKTVGENEPNALYRNENANGNHWLEVRCVGTTANRSGIGAKVRVLATIGGTPVRQLREVDGQSGYCGENLDQHFGLGDGTVIDSLIVEWPGGGRDVSTQVPVDRIVSVVQGAGVTGVDASTEGPPRVALAQNAPNPFAARTRIAFALQRESKVTLFVLDLQGRRVRTLVDGRLNPGRHQASFDATGLPSGVYFYDLVSRASDEAGDTTTRGRMVIVR
jgi:hypothetical protein